jgi:hypothetical protein
VKINILVETSKGKTIPLNIGMSTRVDAVKQILQEKEGIPVDQQRLSYSGKQLDDGQAFLISHEINNESTLRLGETSNPLRRCTS